MSPPYINRAWAYYQKGLYDRAIQDCNEALKVAPESALAYNNRGLAYQMKGEPTKALEDYEKACKLGLSLACDNLREMGN